ncbi:MAG: tRNA guanosine(34) transglycosylase Tgt [Candidatus Levyibacteriota bacterium]
MNKIFKFKIVKSEVKSKVRAGEIITSHGVVHTPAFVVVGTQATVKSLMPEDLKNIGVEILFGNTYHLHLRPGEDVIQELGGLGKFMGWSGATITDSGGFQVFSLNRGKTLNRTQNNTENDFGAVPRPPVGGVQRDSAPVLVKITDNGVEFRSHLDGSKHIFTPEKSIEIQQKLGADIILAFDECAPHPSTCEYTKKAMERTHEWAVRCLKAFNPPSEESRSLPRHLGGGRMDSSEVNLQALYGIIHGGIYKDLREESAKFISNLSFDGIAIGGVAVGESKKEMRDVLNWVYPFLPEDKPRHLLGIGEVDDIFDAVDKGMDTFDCVIPTRFGRYGIVFVPKPEGNIKNHFRIDLNKSIYARDKGPISKDCKCYTCQNFTRGYLNHLFRAQELLGYRLATYHNLYFIVDLVKQIRESILEGRFEKLKKKWLG